MKTYSSSLGMALLALSLLEARAGTQPAIPQPTPYTVVSRGPNSAVWERTGYERMPDGQIVSQRDRYVQMATGLNHLANGRYVPSSDQIALSPDGTSACATNGQAQAFFPADIAKGVIKLITPDGKTLEGQPIGLGFSDGSNTVLLATLTNSVGEILPGGNEVLYTNAFAGLHVDLLYKYTLAGLEQDVVLRQQLPDAGPLGLRARSTTLDMMTEFFNCPPPQLEARAVPTAAGNLKDDSVSFGVMRMMPGKAFFLGTNQPSVGVVKQWFAFDNRQFLVEQIPYVSVTNELARLPEYTTAFAQPNPNSADPPGLPCRAQRQNAALGLWALLPPALRTRRRLGELPLSKTGKGPPRIQLAQSIPPNHGFMLDYQMINGNLTNYDFQGGTTYYVSGPVYLRGTNTFEGGAVIKYTNNVFAPIVCMFSVLHPTEIRMLTTAYRPVIFTAMDDNSVGAIIAGSTGQPTNYYANPALEFGANGQLLKYLQIRYAKIAIEDGTENTFDDIQIVDCESGVEMVAGVVSLRNALFANVPYDFNLDNEQSGVSIKALNSTFSSGSYLIYDPYSWYGFPTNWTACLTNCIFANVTNKNSNPSANLVTGNHNGFYESSTFGTSQFTTNTYPFQAAAGGNYYLATNSSFRDVGTTNIDPTLLTELRTTTTQPPLLLTNQTFAVTTNLGPLDLADNNTPDLGYHYPILDYVFSQCQVDGESGANTLTFESGTAVGWYGRGLALTNYATVNFDGLVASNCYFVRCNTVQEADQSGDTNATGITCTDPNSASFVNAYFTRFSAIGDLAAFFDASLLSVTPYNCEFWDGLLGGEVTGLPDLTLDNCLLDRSSVAFYTTSSSLPWYLTMQNCTLHGGSMWLDLTNGNSQITAHDCAFDSTNITLAPSNGNGMFQDSYNAYLTNATALPQDADDRTVTNFNWQTGPLGHYYLPPDSPLIDHGDYSASLVIDYPSPGLSYNLDIFTTQTNETPDAGLVDIGYHYAAPLPAVSFNNFSSPICPDGQWSFNLFNKNYGSTDLWGLPVTFSTTNPPQYGSLTNTDNIGDYTYRATNCYVGADSFTYQMNDSLFTSPPATVYVMVAENLFKNTSYTPSPVIVPLNGSTNITITAQGDCDGSPVTLSNVMIIQPPAHGTLSNLVSSPPYFYTSYTATNNYTGPDSLEFQVSDACGDAARFIVPITVGTNAAGPFTIVTNITPNGVGVGPVGMAYSPTQHALIVSDQNGDPDFNGDDFVQLATNTNGALTVTNFSGVAGLPEEVELAIVQSSANGSVYFGSTYNIGRLSDDGGQSNLNWCILTNNTTTNIMNLRGGLYFDQTGVFSNELIALTCNNKNLNQAPEVWLANPSGNPALLTQVPLQILSSASASTLEGVISLPDDTNQWGPWAGKILTGDENYAILYTIDANGTITTYDLGIAPDNFAFIPTNQDLYFCDLSNERVLKLASTFLANYVGDLLIVQEGEHGNQPGLMIVNWNGADFVSRFISASSFNSGHVEDATFAPLHLPSRPLQ